MSFRPSPLPSLRAVTLLFAWFFLSARAKAETGISYKYADYREADDRIVVESHYGFVEQTIGTDMRLKLNGVIDAIAGATPTGEPPATPGGPVPLANMEDRRKAWGAELFRQFPRVGMSIGVANSRESDYVSTGLSLNTLTDFNQKNTTLLVGIAGTDDDIKVFHQTEPARKRTFDLITGVTQLLDPRTSVTLNLGYGRSEGFHADPYRLIQKHVEIFPGVVVARTFPENRPDERDKFTAYAAIQRAYPNLHGTLEANYRLFDDSFGTTSHTLEIAWFQQIGPRVTLRPSFRFYQQSAADFYLIDLDGTDIVPGNQPDPDGPFYSADYRVSALRSYHYGLKAIFALDEHWQLDASIERYEMDGRDGITSPSAYPRAVLFNLGARLTW